MRNFKFLRETVDNPDMLNEETYATASFNANTPEGAMIRRRIYHTDRDHYNRLRNPLNNEMEQYFYDRNLRPDTLTAERISEITRRINGGERSIPFFTGGSTAIKVNPKWWMKIKMLYQKFKYNTVIETNSDALTIFFIATTVTIIFGLMIAKVLNIW
jgi:hypothetical protein